MFFIFLQGALQLAAARQKGVGTRISEEVYQHNPSALFQDKVRGVFVVDAKDK